MAFVDHQQLKAYFRKPEPSFSFFWPVTSRPKHSIEMEESSSNANGLTETKRYFSDEETEIILNTIKSNATEWEQDGSLRGGIEARLSERLNCAKKSLRPYVEELFTKYGELQGAPASLVEWKWYFKVKAAMEACKEAADKLREEQTQRELEAFYDYWRAKKQPLEEEDIEALIAEILELYKQEDSTAIMSIRYAKEFKNSQQQGTVEWPLFEKLRNLQ